MRLPSTLTVKAAFLIATVLAAPVTVAETITIPLGQQTLTSDTERPTLGMSKESVEKQFGKPKEKIAAKGEPPISRWVYENFVVYFEYNTVLHSVVRHQPQSD